MLSDKSMWLLNVILGTAFFPLQSCMNHSCCPNAKAFKRDEVRGGKTSFILFTT